MAKFPKFVLGFLLISVLATYHFFNKEQVGALANLSRWAFLLTFAGVGLRTNFSDMRKQGLRPFAVGAIGEVVIAGFTLGFGLRRRKNLWLVRKIDGGWLLIVRAPSLAPAPTRRISAARAFSSAVSLI